MSAESLLVTTTTGGGTNTSDPSTTTSEPPHVGWYLICPSYGKINHVYFQVNGLNRERAETLTK